MLIAEFAQALRELLAQVCLAVHNLTSGLVARYDRNGTVLTVRILLSHSLT
jgi:hypothetical protein